LGSAQSMSYAAPVVKDTSAELEREKDEVALAAEAELDDDMEDDL
jgi:hypothetical protein